MSLLIPVDAFDFRFFEITGACNHFYKKRFSRILIRNFIGKNVISKK